MDPEKKLAILFEDIDEKAVRRGEPIPVSLQGEDHVHFLTGGYVRQVVRRSDGGDISLHVFKPGSCFPLMDLYLERRGKPYQYYAETEVLIKSMPKADFHTFISRHPDIQQYFLRKVFLGMDGLLSRMESLVLDDAHARVVSFFLYAGRSFGQASGRSVVITLPLTHKKIASWLGIARETTSLIIERLTAAGHIRKSGGSYVISNMKMLAEELVRDDG